MDNLFFFLFHPVKTQTLCKKVVQQIKTIVKRRREQKSINQVKHKLVGMSINWNFTFKKYIYI